ncbi:hypothetical protein B0H14DRAFT_2559924 [Mycena olivaceomarginata]|nr:hypothetical protein B0H14DRAFT_2559924 [Mycena olivaceomarginata]
MFKQTAKSRSQNLPMESSSKSEDDLHGSYFEHTQILDRWDRAFCRVLVQRHDGSQSTISKAVKNQYAQPDQTEEDDRILSGPNFNVTLKKVEMGGSPSIWVKAFWKSAWMLFSHARPMQQQITRKEYLQDHNQISNCRTHVPRRCERNVLEVRLLLLAIQVLRCNSTTVTATNILIAGRALMLPGLRRVSLKTLSKGSNPPTSAKRKATASRSKVWRRSRSKPHTRAPTTGPSRISGSIIDLTTPKLEVRLMSLGPVQTLFQAILDPEEAGGTNFGHEVCDDLEAEGETLPEYLFQVQACD